MTVEGLRNKVREWDTQRSVGSTIAEAKYSSILDQIEYHAANEWKVFSPAEHVDENSNYMERLASWVGNLTAEEDQKVLLEYALYISFFSREDFYAFYRTALNRDIASWIASQIGLTLKVNGGQGYHQTLNDYIRYRTWYCPVTDSMDINEFCKVNHLTGIADKPHFDSLQRMAGPHPNRDVRVANHWINFMASPNPQHPPLERLVLLEDIVGSGTQCLPAVRWAVESLGVPVLFVPLIICPNGLEVLRAEEVRWQGQLTVRPVIELQRSDLLGPEARGMNAWPLSQDLENLAERYINQASPNMEPFGFGNTGSSVVKYSNTPDNTLPIVHNRVPNGNWEPLFPRIFRD